MFSLWHHIQTGFGIHPTGDSVGTGENQSAREADDSLLPGAEVKITSRFTSIPVYTFLAYAYDQLYVCNPMFCLEEQKQATILNSRTSEH
jgi:hypothetical protein